MVENRGAQPPLLVALVASLALAGCSGGGGGGADGPAADFGQFDLQATSTTGIIRGVVVDEAIRPVAGVDIGTTLPDGATRNVTSLADGAFGFDGLPAGTYRLEARKAGFAAVQSTVDVVAGVAEPPITKILLAADPSSLPYVSAFVYDAFVACSFTFPVVSFAACGLVAEQTNNEFLINYQADKPPALIQTEAIWETTQALGNELGLSITDFSTDLQETVNATNGPSPIYITVNATDALRLNYTSLDGNDITIRLFSTELTGTDVVPEEQAHGLWSSTLYGPVNGTGLPATYQSTVVDNDPSGLLGNPFSDPDCIKYAALFDSCQRFGGAGMALQQKVTVFTHIYYGYAPPVDWRFSADGQAPPPPA